MVRIMKVEVLNFVQVLFLLVREEKISAIDMQRIDRRYSPSHARLLTERTVTASVIVERAVIG